MFVVLYLSSCGSYLIHAVYLNENRTEIILGVPSQLDIQISGYGTAAKLGWVYSLYYDIHTDLLWMNDYYFSNIRHWNSSSNELRVIMGHTSPIATAGFNDGQGLLIGMNSPSVFTIVNGIMYCSEDNARRIRLIDLNTLTSSYGLASSMSFGNGNMNSFEGIGSKLYNRYTYLC